MRTIPLIGLILALLLSAALGYVLFWAWEPVGNPEFRENVDRIQDLQKLNNRWSLAALRNYSAPLSNFDTVSTLLPKIRAAKQDLLDSTLNSDRVPQSLNNVLQDYLAQFDGKEQDIERFKSYYAIVRNSATYLPQVTERLMQQVAQAGLSDLAKEITKIQGNMTSFMKQPNNGLHMILDARIKRLFQEKASYPEALATLLQEYASHVRVLLKYKPPLDKLLAKIADERIDEKGVELVSLYRDYEHSTHNGKVKPEQWILIIAITATSLFLIFSIVMLLERGGGRRYYPSDL